MKLIYIIFIITNFLYLGCRNESIDYIHIKSINPVDTNFIDLQPMKDVLKNIDVVLLGEQSHGDGSTIEAKIRFIEFLHQEMGFNVLAFESGALDCYKIWSDILSKDKNATVYNKKLWMNYFPSQQIIPLFEYIEKNAKASHPLYFMGIDAGGKLLRTDLDLEFTNFLNEYHLNCLLKNNLGILQNLIEKTSFGYAIFSQEDSLALLNNLSKIITFLKSIKSNNPDSLNSFLWQKEFEIIEGRTKFYHYYNSINYGWSSFRDSIMASNLIQLKENIFPHEKIIVWAATQHILSHPTAIKFFINHEVKFMGEYLHEKYKSKVYSIGFTSAFGKMWNYVTKEVVDLKPPTKKSLEMKLLNLNNNYIFINFQSPKNKLFFNKSMPAKFLGNIEINGNWPQTLDGMFFIKTLKPLLIRNK